MSLPGEHTNAPQVWDGHPPVPTWETPLYRIGRKGLNLVDGLDDLDPQELSRMVNVVSRFGSPIYTRLGQTALATTTGTDRVHSLTRLNDPGASSFTRLAGSSTNVYRGQSGALTLIDSNYSGDPLTFAAVSMPLGNTPYVFIGDRSRNRKVARTGAVSPIGLQPGSIISTTVQAQASKSIVLFQAGDSSNAAAWTMTAGQDRSVPPNATAAPTAIDDGTLVQVLTNPAGAATDVGYDSIISIARTLDLTTFGGGIDAADEDLIHLRINVSNPAVLEELKLYFVCSPFTAGAVPGNSVNNTQAWYKAIRPNDFAAFHDRTESSTDASETLRTNELLQQFKEDNSVFDDRSSINVTAGVTEISRTQTPTFPAGRNVWGEFGILGIPLRRGDFSRVGVGQASSFSWATITGIVIVIQTTTDEPITITFSYWSMDGGYKPDVADPGAQAYDYRVRHYDTATGAKGNPSAVFTDAQKVNPVRQQVLVTPNAAVATVSPTIRQQLFRRGGGAATSTDWFFVSQNSTDGGVLTDNTADDEIVAEETLEIDNDQPVTSVSTSGATILNQIVPIYFRVGEYMFALGDPNQPGRLYRSKLQMPESWPADEFEDVCAASEELMNGGVYASQGYVFSRTRLYTILLNDLDGSWSTDPTACAEGMVGRWAQVSTPYGIAFVSPFGVRLTQGGPPERLSDEQIGPLFQGLTVRGLSPINFSVPTAILLEYYDNELWFTYQDSGGTRRQLIFNFFDKAWRAYVFGEPVCVAYSEPVQGAAGSLLLGGNATGQVYTHSGFSDDGAAIAYALRTGAWTYGESRKEKLLSEVVLDGELQTATVTMTAYLNDEATTVTAQTATGTAGPRRYVFEPFGTTPQHARNVAIDLAGNAPTGAALFFNQLGVTIQLQPEITYTQPTPWEELPGGEGYCFGMLITCDTGGVDKDVDVEYTMRNGAVAVAASLVINAAGRRKLPFTWGNVLAHQIRLRPTTPCEPWMRFKIEWLSDPEPPRLQGWDTNWENFGTFADKWLKGYLIEADTFGAVKSVVLDMDQALMVNQQSLTFSGRTVQHISFAKLKGRLFRLRAVDSNFGKLFRWQPIFDEEPLALTRWESEERPFPGMSSGPERWQKPLEAYVCLRSSGTVTWTVTTYGSGTTVLSTDQYTIATTGGVKRKARIPMQAVKGLLFAHLFTSVAGFYLYREESEVLVEDFNTGQAEWLSLFVANDDLDPARSMGNAASAAATPGGA